MAREIRIPGFEITGPGLQEPPVDDLADSPGALLYMDLSHPAAPVSGTPGTVPNLAAENAAVISATPVAPITLANTFTSASGKLERTAKGGLLVLPSKVNDVVGQTVQAQMSTGLASWARTRQTDWWFLSASVRLVRTGNAGVDQQILRLGQNTASTIVSVSEGSNGASVFGSPPPNRTSLAVPSTPTLACLSVAAQGSGSLTSIAQSFLLGGPINATFKGKSVAYVLYFAFMDNLTLSGRSYAESRALAEATHAAGHSVGGRWHGDTWTNPTTFP
ncbi:MULTISPECIES: hypothetical protein [unclassified Pseudoclavibacter]|uniref:hypothetical protein n=1 Tax=unclassified Pseudoclavibacter TaxID=2615177 RepID=UPI001BAA8FEA|nr:hypothetical protein [Pseudoclavibacter sp. Marseille-Q4354]MBS3177765.1 hypothetical protein [Pseudoclavibacter sp. Marseille-Q4354]